MNEIVGDDPKQGLIIRFVLDHLDSRASTYLELIFSVVI